MRTVLAGKHGPFNFCVCRDVDVVDNQRVIKILLSKMTQEEFHNYLYISYFRITLLLKR